MASWMTHPAGVNNIVCVPLSVPENHIGLREIAIIAILFLLPRLIFIFTMPLILDEAIYSMMLFEQAHHASIIPTFLGYPVSWKPAPVFWIYGFVSQALLSSGFPIEAALRLPSALLGLASLLPLYLVLRKVGASKDLAFFSIIAFIFSGISIYTQSQFLVDSALFLFIISSIYLYLEDGFGRWRFIAAGLLVFAAFFIKLVFAFLPPLLAIAWFFCRDRKQLKDPVFLISLLMPFLAAGIHYYILQGAGLGNELFIGDIGGHVISKQGFGGQVSGFFDALTMLFVYSPVWVGIFALGLKRWKDAPFMAFWASLIAIPLLSISALPWYFLPILPAISFFAVNLLLKAEGHEKADLFFMITIGLMAVFSLAFFAFLEYYEYRQFQPEKDAGLLMAGKHDVLVIGPYKPSILAYKMQAEERSLGAPLDVGWIVIEQNTSGSIIGDFVQDYHTEKYNTTDGSFSSLFVSDATFRKDSNITRFDYVVLTMRSTYVPADSKLIYSDDQSEVYVYKLG
jgi:hypothetical protein